MSSGLFIDVMRRLALLQQSKGFAYIIPEHILWCLLDEQEFMDMAKRCGARLDTLRSELFAFMNEQEKCENPQDAVPTQEYVRTVKRIGSLADSEFSEVRMGHILMALIDNGEDSFASYQLRKCGMTREKIADCMGRSSSDVLGRFATDLTDLARKGLLDRVVGRQRELDRLIQILHKRRSSCPMVLSQPGVGKTALVEGLAQRIVDGDVPDSLRNASIWSLSLAEVLAGTSMRGEFEERLERLIGEVSSREGVIVFIDEIHMLMDAGTGGGSVNAASILKPHLTHGRLRCIGATTYEEYGRFIARDRAFARRFSRVDLQEPTPDETLAILRGVRAEYEEFHRVKYADDVLEKIVELSGRYLCESHFPDKAIEVMDELGSGFSSKLNSGKPTVEDVERLVSRMANLPVLEQGRSSMDALRDLGKRVKTQLYGQDAVVDEVVQRVKSARAGLTDRDRPLGVFALCGPTGCGKTELARQLSLNMGCPLVRFDMSEYSEENSVARLIGTSPGYVGFEQGGLLTGEVLRSPECVLLFDEIEKAHRSVHSLLLQVMDEGRLTDNRGRTVSFRNTLVFMTSNAGGEASLDRGVTLGFRPEARAESLAREEIARRFPPEFRNRFTALFMFRPLGLELLEMVVDKNIRRLNSSLEERGVSIQLTEEARRAIAERAEAENMGGRPVERLVDALVGEQLVDRILFENLSYTSLVFGVRNGNIEITGESRSRRNEKVRGSEDSARGGRKAARGRGRRSRGGVAFGAETPKGRCEKEV